MQLSTKHLLGIKDLAPQDISLILDTASQFKEVLQRPVKKVPPLGILPSLTFFMRTVPVQEFRLSWLKNA